MPLRALHTTRRTAIYLAAVAGVFSAVSQCGEVKVPPVAEELHLPTAAHVLTAAQGTPVGRVSVRPQSKHGPVATTYFADVGLSWSMQGTPPGVYRLAVVTNTGGALRTPYDRTTNLRVRVFDTTEVVPGRQTVEVTTFTPYAGFPPQPISYWAKKSRANMVGATRVSGLFRVGPSTQVRILARKDRPPLSIYRLLLDPIPEAERQLFAHVKGTAPENVYYRGRPPRVIVTLYNLSRARQRGKLGGAIVDLVAPPPLLAGRKIDLPPWSSKEMTVALPELPGCFFYRPVFTSTGGKPFAAGQIGYTYCPCHPPDKLPLDWPIAHHRFYGNDNDQLFPGVKWMRVFWSWAKIEKEKGTFDWAEMDRRAEIARRCRSKLLYVVQLVPRWSVQPPEKVRMFHGIGAANAPSDMSDLANFIDHLMRRYRDVIGAIEVWNEGNVKAWTEWTPDEYVAMARTIREAARKVNPEVLIVGISVSAGRHIGYMDDLMKAGALEHLDVCSVHCYEELSSPRLNPGSTQRGQIQIAKALMRKYGRVLPVWDTESGLAYYQRLDGMPLTQTQVNQTYETAGVDKERYWISGGRWRAASERRAAAMLQRGVVQMLADDCRMVFFFRDWMLASGDARLHVPACGVIAHLLERRTSAVRMLVDGDAERRQGRPELYVYSWRRTTDTVFAAWRHEQTPDNMANPMLWMPPLTPKQFPVDIGTPDGEVRALGMFLRTLMPFERQGTMLRLPLTEEPVYAIVRQPRGEAGPEPE